MRLNYTVVGSISMILLQNHCECKGLAAMLSL